MVAAGVQKPSNFTGLVVVVNCELLGASASSLQADCALASLGQVEASVITLRQAVGPLDVLIMIAGLLGLPERPMVGDTARPGMRSRPR